MDIFMTPKSLSLLPLAVFFSAHAIGNDTSLDWSQHNNVVRLDSHIKDRQGQCTGTLLAGRYVLTAAHCLQNDDNIDRVTLSSGDTATAEFSVFLSHPDYDPSEDFAIYDIGLIPLAKPVAYSTAQFLAEPIPQSLTAGDKVFVTGFGCTTHDASPLNQAEFTFNRSHWADPILWYIDQANESHTTGGDSSSAWINQDNDIVAVHKGSDVSVSWDENGDAIKTRETYGSDLYYAQDFLLDNINGWHYPTVANVNGTTTITVQSLHHDGAVDSAYVEGEVVITDESKCLTQGVIDPLATCTYVVESNGGEGMVYLSDSEAIHVNPPAKSSGGSMGLWSLILLGLAACRKRGIQ